MAAPKSKRPTVAPHAVDSYIADPRVHIGHVHLKVADLERALRFYAGVLGLEVTQRYGDGAVFLLAAVTIITSRLIRGRAWEVRRRLRAQPGFITRRSFIPRARRWLRRCAGCWLQRFSCRARRTME